MPPSTTDINLSYLALCDLYDYFGTDKNLCGYTALYEPLFRPLRDKPCTILEIGLGTHMAGPSTYAGIVHLFPYHQPAASLRAHACYFAKATLFGIDVAPDCLITAPRIHTALVDSTDAVAAARFIGDKRFDLIIDDGLHTSAAQWASLQHFFPAVADDGLYVIEDLGGGGDNSYLLRDYAEPFAELTRTHEYFTAGHLVIIRKNQSGLGKVDSFRQFSGGLPSFRHPNDIIHRQYLGEGRYTAQLVNYHLQMGRLYWFDD